MERKKIPDNLMIKLIVKVVFWSFHFNTLNQRTKKGKISLEKFPKIKKCTYEEC